MGGYIGIMEYNMETTLMGLYRVSGLRVKASVWLLKIENASGLPKLRMWRESGLGSRLGGKIKRRLP